MICLTTENEKCIIKRNIIWENPCDRSEMSMYKKILVAIGVIFLIFFIVKLCEKGPSEPSSFDSIYEESQEEPQEETSTYDNSDSVVTRLPHARTRYTNVHSVWPIAPAAYLYRSGRFHTKHHGHWPH